SNSVGLRDRDAIETAEGLIFRVFGYSHPPGAYICDAEYASSKIFESKDPRAPRTGKGQLYYKFYNDEGMKLVVKKYPQYQVFHEMLGLNLVGVKDGAIAEARKPEVRLQQLLDAGPTDELLAAMERVLMISLNSSGLKTENFGVFGSMLHGFHHPKYSDIDLIVYGKKENAIMRKTIQALYADSQSGFHNEFESDQAMAGKDWRFKNFTVPDFVWHQRRKQIYGLYDDKASGRTIKAEFEPVKAWTEIKSEYNPRTCITRRGIEPLEVISGPKEAFEVQRIFSFMEEFRQQAQKDEEVMVEGNLEEVMSPTEQFHQVTLTYCPRYYEQVLKVNHN
ncbi:MAG: nucleotidyltransferase domain-containing protein, partial [Candidatus Bathyarchaeia archaeon]